MGSEKFYDSPEGKIRAALLLASGVQYDLRSVEFRLVALHVAHHNDYQRLYDAWTADRLVDLFFTMSTMAKFTDKSRDEYIKKVQEGRDYLFGLLSLTKQPTLPNAEQEKEIQAARDQNNLKYLELLGQDSAGFNSLDELLTTINSLNGAIAHAHTATD